MSGRECKQCGADITTAHPSAKFCGSVCRERSKTVKKSLLAGHWPREMHGPHRGASCPECGKKFEQRDKRQIFCERRGTCHQKAWRRTEKAKAYFSREDVKNRQREAKRQHNTSEHGKAAQKARDSKQSNRERRRQYSMELRKSEVGAMRCRISCIHSNAIRRLGEIKQSPTMEQLGYTPQELAAHLERQFVKGMGWHNRDKWHIDHIVPISTAKTIDDVIALNQLSNLRPLWAHENLSKGDRLEYMI